MFTRPSSFLDSKLELTLLWTLLQSASLEPYSFLQAQFQITFWKQVKRIFNQEVCSSLVVPGACIIAHLFYSSFSHKIQKLLCCYLTNMINSYRNLKKKGRARALR